MGLDIWDLIWAPTWLLIWPLIYSLMFYQPCFWALSKTPPIASELCCKIIIPIKEGECVQWTRDWFKAQLCCSIPLCCHPLLSELPSPVVCLQIFQKMRQHFFLDRSVQNCSQRQFFPLSQSSEMRLFKTGSDSTKTLKFLIGFIAKNVFIYTSQQTS